MRVFVTGGTGLLGNTVIRQLLEQGHQVRAMVRQPPDPEVLAGLEVELMTADLVNASAADARTAEAQSPETQSPEASSSEARTPAAPPPDRASERDAVLEEAIAACDAVVHSAAMIHLGWHHRERAMDVNFGGTQRIVRACLRHGKRLVHVGTVDTIAVGSVGVIADETTPLEHAGGKVPCVYVETKRAAVAAVNEGVAAGLNAVIVHPGFMLGPWDWKPSSGQMMLEVGSGWRPLSPRGGCSLCDARDVAAGVIAALHADCPSGRQYILAGHNWTYQRLWTEMARRMGRRSPLRPIGPGIEFLAGWLGDSWGRLSGKEPLVNSASAAMSGQFHWYDSGRAAKELGYRIRDAEETLDAAAAWLQERFVLPRRVPAR